ncbi:LCP family protein [Clostridium akagii]|uniref:LCP family protein n=1 Tax=Clostridium akagii TaxID=91623 RepID=UPI00047A6B5B|nr:LCP family protein [Clostridium akagii]
MENNKKDFNVKKILKRVGIPILAIFICLAVGITCFSVFYLSGTNSKSNLVNVKAVVPEKNQPVNILLAGVDVGSNDTGDSSKVSNSNQANSIVLFHYEPENKKLNIVSIPRDSLIKVDKKAAKLNYATSVDGAKFLQSSVENLMNIKVNYYVQLDYTSFRNIINSIGGITMNVNKKMDYDDNVQNLHIHFDNGSTQNLDGQKAEEYYRWVKNNNDTAILSGEIGRIKNEQTFLETTMNKFSRFSTIIKYPAIISSVSKNIESNMSTYDVLKYARAFSHLDKSKVTMSVANGLTVGIDSNKYYLMDDAANSKLLGSSVKAKADVKKADVKIEILNGTTKNGFAKGFKTQLNSKGFTNITTGNAPQKPVAVTKLTFYGTDENNLTKINDDMGNVIKASDYELVEEKSNKYDIIVVLGDDINK